jgi:hypothetical protein
MPTIQRTTPGTITGWTAPPQYPSGSQPATIAGFKAAILTLKNVVIAGHVIEAVHYTILAGIYNAYKLHVHAYPDLRGIDTFGNLPTYGGGTFGTPNPKNSFPVTGAPVTAVTALSGGALPTSPPGNAINEADFNTLRTAIVFMRTHSHQITDQTS